MLLVTGSRGVFLFPSVPASNDGQVILVSASTGSNVFRQGFDTFLIVPWEFFLQRFILLPGKTDVSKGTVGVLCLILLSLISISFLIISILKVGFSDWTGSDVSTKSVRRPGGMKLFT